MQVKLNNPIAIEAILNFNIGKTATNSKIWILKSTLLSWSIIRDNMFK